MNTTHAEQYEEARNAKYAALIQKLSSMSADGIRAKIEAMRKRAAFMPARCEWEASQLRRTANRAENHFFLILNPACATAENIEFAKQNGYALL